MMMQHFIGGSSVMRSIQDRIGVELCAFRKGTIASK
jgi:hypothetical protein